MADTYTTRVLIGVVESREGGKLQTFFRNFFPFRVQSDREEILFDVVDKKKRLAPFVSPLVKGKIMEAWGYVTRVFKPAYLKPKGVVRPTDAIKRLAGEKLNGEMSMAERRNIHIRNHLFEQDDACDNREEVMCAEALRLGQVTVSGDGYPTQVISFGRNSAHRIVLSGADLWSASTATPNDDLEEWAELVRDNGDGAVVTDWIMGTRAFKAYKNWLKDNEPDLLKILLNAQNRGQTTSLQMGPQAARKIVNQGTVGEFQFWTYSDTYQDEDGVTQQVFPKEEVLGVSMDVEGTICYGAIMDADAGESGLAVMERFPKNWKEADPSAEYVMTQSAPLAVPLRPNATVSAVVLA
ncbi:MAG TPA: major capsid protein [Longimicrobium sp.]|jgi:hypothetical protein